MELEKILARWKEFRYTKNIPLPEVNAAKISLPKVSRRTFGRIALGTGAAAGVVAVGYGSCQFLGLLADAVGGGSLDDYLPEGFKGLEFGMNYQEVQRIRPFVKTKGKEDKAYEILSKETKLQFLEFFKGENQGFVEEMSNDFNRQSVVKYQFEANKLNKIKFEFDGADCNSYYLIDRFRHGAEKLFGKASGKDSLEWRDGKLKVHMHTWGDSYRCTFYYTLKEKGEDRDNK